MKRRHARRASPKHAAREASGDGTRQRGALARIAVRWQRAIAVGTAIAAAADERRAVARDCRRAIGPSRLIAARAAAVIRNSLKLVISVGDVAIAVRRGRTGRSRDRRRAAADEPRSLRRAAAAPTTLASRSCRPEALGDMRGNAQAELKGSADRLDLSAAGRRAHRRREHRREPAGRRVCRRTSKGEDVAKPDDEDYVEEQFKRARAPGPHRRSRLTHRLLRCTAGGRLPAAARAVCWAYHAAAALDPRCAHAGRGRRARAGVARRVRVLRRAEAPHRDDLRPRLQPLPADVLERPPREARLEHRLPRRRLQPQRPPERAHQDARDARQERRPRLRHRVGQRSGSVPVPLHPGGRRRLRALQGRRGAEAARVSAQGGLHLRVGLLGHPRRRAVGRRDREGAAAAIATPSSSCRPSIRSGTR